jgi:hypothetical protein
MADKSVLQFADSLKKGEDPRNIRGLCYIVGKADELPQGYLELPSYETVKTDNKSLIDMFHTFYRNNDALNAVGLYQKHVTR